jgi:cysteine desulfurase/selenocysteine lyase
MRVTESMMQIRQDFPLLQQTMRNKPLVYLDSSATTQKPTVVIEAIRNYYHYDNANVHRGVYQLSERATNAYESARQTVQQFINAQHAHEIIFTRGTTEAINLVASSFGQLAIRAGDEIIISAMEHHANIVPWQMLCARTGAVLKVIPVNDDGLLNLPAYHQLLNARTKLVALIHVSNVLGTLNPAQEMIAAAHQHNIPVLLDGAQAIAHRVIDVQALDCDFYVFSSHKLYGPTGVGVLYGKTAWLEAMPPYQGGGDMIRHVSFEKTEYNSLPYKFEAGTPPIAGVIGLAAAIQYVHKIGFENIMMHESQLTQYAMQKLQTIPGIRIYGHDKNKIGVISFTLAAAHPHDIGTVLDSEGIAIRAGHHCAMPLMTRFQVPAMARASIGIYNDYADINHLHTGLSRVLKLFG